MRYAQGGGLTDQRRAFREKLSSNTATTSSTAASPEPDWSRLTAM
ncbi:hypothetical protein [Streptomyces sp. NBC_00582]|nr:hypothetical protein [Streptomyces sp. NBC_00582]WUB59246.1 hypothetical protein OG852_01770 [Streptomyces sp. NBC_00582]